MTVNQLIAALQSITGGASGDLPVVRENVLGLNVTHGETRNIAIEEIQVVIDKDSKQVRVVLS